MERPKDPSVKGLRSGFGDQVRSTSPSQPSIGFGSGSRDASLKVSPFQAAQEQQHRSSGFSVWVHASVKQGRAVLRAVAGQIP